MTHLSYKDEYLGFIDDTVRKAKRTADRAMVQFITLRLLMVAASASLPALTLLPHRGWTIGAAVLVAVLAGLDTQFQWGEEWRHFRSTQLTLAHLRREYEKRNFALKEDSAVDDIKTEVQNFTRLFDDVENLLRSEVAGFFRFRIAPWKTQSAPNAAQT